MTQIPAPTPETLALAQQLGPADVAAAAERIAGRVVRTPAIRNAQLDDEADAELWLKAENLQRIGAFKARGAMHAVGRLDPTEREKGILTYSSGNHAQAVALAAKAYGVPATIAMPVDAPKVKVAGVRRLGAEVVFAGTTSDDRKARAHEIHAQTGAVIIQPFDHEDIICGQGTATAELLEDVAAATDGGTLDALLVPCGGGGVTAGACLAARELDFPIWSVEPHGCDAMARSLEAGQRVAVPPGPTIGDGLKPVAVGSLNFEIAHTRLRGGLRVDDAEMGDALVRLLFAAKVLVEPSGAAGLAVALRGLPDLLRPTGRRPRIGVILTGGNVDPALVAALIERHAPA